MKPIITLLLVLLALNAGAQEIFGKIVNENGDPVIIGAVLVKQNGVLKDGACSDYDGFYLVKSLAPGYYDVTVFYGCYDTITMTKVLVGSTGRTTANFNLTQSPGTPKHVEQPYKRKLVIEEGTGVQSAENPKITCIDRQAPMQQLCQCHAGEGYILPTYDYGTFHITDRITSQNIELPAIPYPGPIVWHSFYSGLTAAEITNVATTDMRDAVANSSFEYQRQRNTYLNIAGAGPYGTLYVVDGVQMAR